MTERRNISVWLVLKNSENKGKVVLQKRSSLESFSYIHQATWSGKVEAEESVMDAVKRECKEELGKEFFKNFNFSELKFFGHSSAITNNIRWLCSNYLGTTQINILEKSKIHNEAFPCFTFIGKEDEIYSIESGKDPKNNIVLFDDQYDILNKILFL